MPKLNKIKCIPKASTTETKIFEAWSKKGAIERFRYFRDLIAAFSTSFVILQLKSSDSRKRI